jgi:O-succinylbenzoic acid--CoA ligase
MMDLLARRAATTPDRTALVDAASGEAWSYAALDAAVDRTAGRLGEAVGAGDHLGVLLGTRPAFVRVAFAAWRLGATLVPLHGALTAAELATRGRRVDLDAVVAHPDDADRAVDAASNRAVLTVDAGLASGDGGERSEDEAGTGPDWHPDDTCLLLFTSGTTGDPKVVRLTPRNLFWSALGSAFRLGVAPGDRWFDPLSVAHMGGLAPVVRSALYGTAVVLQGEFDADAALAAMREHDCTGVSLVPTMLGRLLDAGEVPDLRFVLLGGGAAPPDLIARCERQDVPVYPTYGATETASQVATATPAEAFADPETVGRPLLPTSVSILDDAGDPVGAGETGELVVAGPTVSPGYYDAPEATAEAFRGGAFHTGDAGYREDGRLFVVGRRDERIVTGGENVDPTEVAEALAEHPAVADASVVGLPDEEWGQRVAALVVAEAVGADDLRAHCRERLAPFKLPRTVGFAAELPRTASGTVDREAVRERLLSGDDR